LAGRLIGIIDRVWTGSGEASDLRWWRHPQESLIWRGSAVQKRSLCGGLSLPGFGVRKTINSDQLSRAGGSILATL